MLMSSNAGAKQSAYRAERIRGDNPLQLALLDVQGLANARERDRRGGRVRGLHIYISSSTKRIDGAARVLTFVNMPAVTEKMRSTAVVMLIDVFAWCSSSKAGFSIVVSDSWEASTMVAERVHYSSRASDI
jgi:hypothetical protein